MPEDNVENKNAEQEKDGKKKKGGFKFILIGIFVVFCLGIGGVYFFYGNAILAKFFNKSTTESEKKVERKVGPIMSLEPFLFNVANSSRFAKISIGIEMKDIKSIEEAKSMTLLIRDKILSVLGSKSIEVLMDVNSRDTIKQELLIALKGIFKKPDDINAIYITDFIIQ